MLNAQQYKDLLTDEYTNAGQAVPAYPANFTANNNWQDLTYRTANQSGLNVGLSGGTEKGTFYIGLGDLTQDGIINGTNFKRYSANISLEQNTPNPVSNTTNVPYSIPKNAKNAQLIIRNNSGEMVRQLALPAGAGVASIDASVLSSGTYNYSLIVDGKIIRSRKMIVSH